MKSKLVHLPGGSSLRADKIESVIVRDSDTRFTGQTMVCVAFSLGGDYVDALHFGCETIEAARELAEKIATDIEAAEDDLAASVLGVCPEEYDASRLAVQTIQLQDRVHTASGYTVLEAMENAEIFKVTPLHDGMFLVDVLCDYYFRAYLTKDQLLALAEELRVMACWHDCADAIREGGTNDSAKHRSSL